MTIRELGSKFHKSKQETNHQEANYKASKPRKSERFFGAINRGWQTMTSGKGSKGKEMDIPSLPRPEGIKRSFSSNQMEIDEEGMQIEILDDESIQNWEKCQKVAGKGLGLFSSDSPIQHLSNSPSNVASSSSSSSSEGAGSPSQAVPRSPISWSIRADSSSESREAAIGVIDELIAYKRAIQDNNEIVSGLGDLLLELTKLHKENPKDDDIARRLQKILDQVKELNAQSYQYAMAHDELMQSLGDSFAFELKAAEDLARQQKAPASGDYTLEALENIKAVLEADPQSLSKSRLACQQAEWSRDTWRSVMLVKDKQRNMHLISQQEKESEEFYAIFPEKRQKKEDSSELMPIPSFNYGDSMRARGFEEGSFSAGNGKEGNEKAIEFMDQFFDSQGVGLVERMHIYSNFYQSILDAFSEKTVGVHHWSNYENTELSVEERAEEYCRAYLSSGLKCPPPLDIELPPEIDEKVNSGDIIMPKSKVYVLDLERKCITVNYLFGYNDLLSEGEPFRTFHYGLEYDYAHGKTDIRRLDPDAFPDPVMINQTPKLP